MDGCHDRRNRKRRRDSGVLGGSESQHAGEKRHAHDRGAVPYGDPTGRVPTACSYSLSPTTATYNKDAADGTFAVTAPADCSWTATSSASWVTFTAGDRGDGQWQCVLSSLAQPRIRQNAPRRSACRRPDVHRQTAGDRAVSVLGRTRRRQPLYGRWQCDDDGDDAAELQLDGVSRRVVAERVERIIGHRNWRGHRDRSQQLRRPAHRDDSGALADSDVGSERSMRRPAAGTL